MRYALFFLLALTASAGAAAPAHHGGAPVSIEVVDLEGYAFPLYPLWRESTPTHQRAYLQAEPGARYALRVTNQTAGRVGVVMAVDGRNVISGKRSDLAPSERMYILGPWQSATYDGWRTGRRQVNAFYFTSEADSYAAAFGDESALGVIALAAYPERGVPPVYGHSREESHGRSESRSSRNRQAPSPSASQDSTAMHDDGAATGFGETRYSPSREVKFRPGRHALTRSYIKYAWASTLCELGVTRCHQRGNRFWPAQPHLSRDGFAPPPPGYRGAE